MENNDLRFLVGTYNSNSGLGVTLVRKSSELQSFFYQPLDECVLKSRFWEYANTPDDVVDGTKSEGAIVDQTFSAQVLSETLTMFFQKTGFPIRVVSRSPDIDDNPDYHLIRGNEFYGHRFILGGEMGLFARGQMLMYLNQAVFDDNDFDLADFDVFKAVKDTTAIIRHEIVHAMQFFNRAKQQKISRVEAKRKYWNEGVIVPQNEGALYYSSPLEIDAYAHEFAERMLREHGLEKTLTLLRFGLPSATFAPPRLLVDFVETVNCKNTVSRLMGKIYTNVVTMTSRGLFENDDKLPSLLNS